VLSAQAVMRPAAGADGFAGEVAADARIEAIAKRVLAAPRPLAVTDGTGRVIGQIDRAAVLAVLVGDQPAAGDDRPGPGGDRPAAAGDRPAAGGDG